MNEKFKYIWRAIFKRKTITQDKNDRYSKHDPKAEWNPSSFRDFQDYFHDHREELTKFELVGVENTFVVDLSEPSKPTIYCDRRSRYGSTTHTIIHREKRPLHDIRIIYFRKCECVVKDGNIGFPRIAAYCIGYQGLDDNGNNRQKVITVV